MKYILDPIMELLLVFPPWISTASVIVACISTGLLLFFISSKLFISRGKSLPPMNDESIFTTVQSLMDGSIIDLLHNNMRKKGSIFRLNMPELATWIVVCDPKFARFILDTEPEKATVYKSFDKATKHTGSVFTKRTHGEGWQGARKAMGPSFSMNQLLKALPGLYVKVDKFRHILDQHISRNEPIEISSNAINFTMDFLYSTMFLVDYETLNKEISARYGDTSIDLLQEMTIVIWEYAQKQAFNPLRQFMLWDTEVLRAKVAAERLYEANLLILDKYRRTHTPEQIQADPSILGNLVRSPYPSDVARSADMLIFLIAGHDTTGYSLSWILIEIAKHPLIYDKIKLEMDQIISPNTDHISLDELSQLKYLDLVITEGMRVWPVTSFGSVRELSKDLQYEKMTLPKGSVVVLPSTCITKVGIKDPELFIPERWEEDAPDILQLRELHMPFSIGKRNCVGQNLAMLELKLTLAHLLHSFRFTMDPSAAPLGWRFFLTIKPVNGMLVAERVQK